MNLNSLIVKLPSRTGQLTSCFSQPCKLMSQGETNLNISGVSSFFFSTGRESSGDANTMLS